MKLTGSLKEKVSIADTNEEKKALIEEAGMELSDDELDAVAGGYPNFKPEVDRSVCRLCSSRQFTEKKERLSLHAGYMVTRTFIPCGHTTSFTSMI